MSWNWPNYLRRALPLGKQERRAIRCDGCPKCGQRILTQGQPPGRTTPGSQVCGAAGLA